MKRNIILLLLAFVVLDALAKANSFSANDSVCIIEGTIKNIPDGCDVILYGSAGKYSGKQKTVTQIKKGKFRFEKKVKGDEDFRLYLYPCIENIRIYLSPGTKTTITGNSTHPCTWTIKSNNALQQEENAYIQYERKNIPEFESIKIRLNDIDSELYFGRPQKEAQALPAERKLLAKNMDEMLQKRIKVFYSFMKDRAYSEIFARYLSNIAKLAKYVEKKDGLLEEPLSEIVRELLAKVPQEELHNSNIIDVMKTLHIQQDNINHSENIESSTPDFRKTITTSANENGWCVFFDANNSYEVDGHTDVYHVVVKENSTSFELVDKTNRLISAGCPVILHLNDIMEDGTHHAVLTETKEITNNNDVIWNLLTVSSAGEKIKGWRLGVNNNEVGLYPWETANAEEGIVYLKMPNTFMNIPELTISSASLKWVLGERKPLGRIEGSTHALLKRAFTKTTDTRYCSFPQNSYDMKAITLKGKQMKLAEGNEFIYPRFLIGDILFESSLWGYRYYHVCNFGNNEWGELKHTFEVSESDPNKLGWARFDKTPDNSLVIYDEHLLGNKYRSVIVIPNATSIESIADSTKWKKYDISQFNDMGYNSINICSLSDSTFLTLASQTKCPDGMMTIIDYKNQKRSFVNFLPDDGIEIDSIIKQAVYSENAMIFSNGKGRFLNMTTRERYAFIFSIKDNKVNIIKFLYNTHLDYRPQPYRNFNTYRVRYEKLYCNTTTDNIYVLLLDRDKLGKKIKSMDKPYYYGDIVEIYDWDGKQQKKVIKLDHMGSRIMLSEDRQKLYLFADDYWEGDPAPKIWTYDISNIDTQITMDYIEAIDAQYEYVEKTDNIEMKSSHTKVVNEGDMMADFELYDYDDKPHHLNEFVGTGKYTILEFSGLGCGPCHAAKPFLEKFYKDNKDRFEMITISNDNEKLWKKKPLGEVSWHEWNDHKSAREISIKYGVNAIPTFIIISPDGKIEKKCLAVGSFMEALKEYIPAEDVSKIMKE